MNSNQYQCVHCKGIFEMAWTKEEAEEEYRKKFPKELIDNSEPLLLCDDCYKLFDPDLHPDKVAAAIAEFYSKRN